MAVKKKMTLPVDKVAGAESWFLRKGNVDAAVTQVGGHLAPVCFKIGKKVVQPYAVAPWTTESIAATEPPLMHVLRGDFFCMPFGGNATVYGKEKHPVHGQTANLKWKLSDVKQTDTELAATFSLRTTIRPGRVQKMIRLVADHHCIYSRHTLSGFSGPMPLGHHATLKFPDEPMSGFLSTSPFSFGQVYPAAFENPAVGGYQSLKPGAIFKSLLKVPMIDGSHADLTHYPARFGFEDLVMLVANPRQRLGWTAVAFPREGYVWFALKDTQVLRNTVMWMSNGGRHYAPWNSRHTHVLGLEEVTSYFHCGLAESANPNPLSRKGMSTAIELNPQKPTVVNYIMGVVGIPQDFDRVAAIHADADRKHLTLVSTAGHEVRTPVDLGFLY